MSVATASLPDGCAYVPLSKYDWALFDILTGPRGRCLGVSLAFNPAVWCLTAALHAATVWMASGLNLQMFMTFKRRNTLYFWSILITTWGILVVVVLFDLRNFTPVGNGEALQWTQSIAWIAESMGFSFVLISRLYLIADCRKLNLLPIIVVILDSTVHILVLVGKAGHLSPKAWSTIIYFTPIFFTVQETLLSSLYVYLFIKFMRYNHYGARTRSMFSFLVFAEIVVICFDVAMVTLNSLKYEIAKTVLTPFFYASKLKIEFLVLNRLMEFKQGNCELEYSCPFSEEVSPSPGLSGLPSTDQDSSTQHVSEVSCGSEKAGGGLSTATREVLPSPVVELRDVDGISRLERQYLGRSNTHGAP